MNTTLNKLKRGDHTTIVALGDSITANSLHNRGHMNWVSLLDEAIMETYGQGVCTLINAGVPGSSYTDALTRLDRDVLRFNPDLVIIALGMNDASKRMEYLPTFKKEVCQVIDSIRQNSSREVLLMTPNPIVVETGGRWIDKMVPGDVFDAWPLSEYSMALVEIVKNKKCAIVDHYHSWKNAEVQIEKLHHSLKNMAYQYRLWPRMANSTHPGPLGHLAFYREIAAVFELPRYFSWEIR